jgi:hypothetical protein
MEILKMVFADITKLLSTDLLLTLYSPVFDGLIALIDTESGWQWISKGRESR